MSRINGGARLSYVRLDVTIHRTTPKAFLVSQGMEGVGERIWLPRVVLSHAAEEYLESIDVFPAACDDVEIVKWKADELGWRP